MCPLRIALAVALGKNTQTGRLYEGHFEYLAIRRSFYSFGASNIAFVFEMNEVRDGAARAQNNPQARFISPFILARIDTSGSKMSLISFVRKDSTYSTIFTTLFDRLIRARIRCLRVLFD